MLENVFLFATLSDLVSISSASEDTVTEIIRTFQLTHYNRHTGGDSLHQRYVRLSDINVIYLRHTLGSLFSKIFQHAHLGTKAHTYHSGLSRYEDESKMLQSLVSAKSLVQPSRPCPYRSKLITIADLWYDKCIWTCCRH
jgi:hypothetical protein